MSRLSQEVYERAAANLTTKTGLKWQVVFRQGTGDYARTERGRGAAQTVPSPWAISCVVETDKPGKEFAQSFKQQHGFQHEFEPYFGSLSYQTTSGETQTAGTNTDHWGDFQKPGVKKSAEVVFMNEAVISAISYGVFRAPDTNEEEISQVLSRLRVTTGIEWSVRDHSGMPVLSSANITNESQQRAIVESLNKMFSAVQTPPFNVIQINKESTSRGGFFNGRLYFTGSTAVKGIATVMNAVAAGIPPASAHAASAPASLANNPQGFLQGAAAAASRRPFVLNDPQGDNTVTCVVRDDAKQCYLVQGKNNSGEPRQIQIYDDGRVTGFRDGADLGIVGKQMYANREAIFQHFNCELPASHKPAGLRQ
jgi:hypothetical protein